MRVIRFAFNSLTFLAFALVLSAISTDAQKIVVNYKFLETTVVDSKGKPVDGAVVETLGYREKTLQTMQTDRDGRLPKGMPVSSGHVNTIGFRVSKPGYFSFEDLGAIRDPFDSGSSQSIRLELLTVPKTRGEFNAVGDQQRRREFLLAAKKGDVATVRKLLQTGLDANITTSELRGVPGPRNVPAIIWAAISGDGETVITLLAAGASVSGKGNLANKALLVYLQADYWNRLSGTESDEQIRIVRNAYDNGVRKLIEAGADSSGTTVDSGKTTLMLCASRCTTETMRRLLEKGVPINAKDKYKGTALDDAVGSRELDTVNLLLAAGANPNEIGYESPDICTTPLIQAVQVDSLSIIRSLIRNKADVRLACRNGETVLTFAVRSGHLKAVKTLIELGADVKGKEGRLALAIAKKQQADGVDSRDMINLLEAAGAPRE